MTAQSAHDWALDRWRALLDQAQAATPGPWDASDWLVCCGPGDDRGLIATSVGHEGHDARFIAALGPDRVIVLCGQAIDRLTAHADHYNPAFTWCDECDTGWPCPEVRAWTAWWAGQDDYPEELRRGE